MQPFVNTQKIVRKTDFTTLHTFSFGEMYLNRCFPKRKGVRRESF